MGKSQEIRLKISNLKDIKVKYKKLKNKKLGGYFIVFELKSSENKEIKLNWFYQSNIYFYIFIKNLKEFLFN